MKTKIGMCTYIVLTKYGVSKKVHTLICLEGRSYKDFYEPLNVIEQKQDLL